MKFRGRIIITMLFIVALLQACSCAKKEAKKVDDSANETTVIETAIETAESNSVETTNETESETQQETVQETTETTNLSNVEEKINQAIMESFIDDSEFAEGQMRTPITPSKAKQIALTHANYDISSVTFVKATQKYEDDIVKWVLSFIVNEKQYDYEINAMDGTIVKSYIKTIANTQVPYLPPSKLEFSVGASAIENMPAKAIELDDAIKVAINNANVNIGNVVFTKTEYTFDNGMPSWNIEFNTNTNKYSYNVNGIDGSITGINIE